jgi:hypothetical protein
MSGARSARVLAERISHEQELRRVHDRYEREIRVLGQEHERETRELVTKLEDVARVIQASVVEGRLEVLNGERARQEVDRSSFATRAETKLSFDALTGSTAQAIKTLAETTAQGLKTLTDAVIKIQLDDREAMGGSQGRRSGFVDIGKVAYAIVGVVLGLLGATGYVLAVIKP